MIRTKVILGFIGTLMVIVGGAMLSCVVCSFIYKEQAVTGILMAALITMGIGFLLTSIFKGKENINFKESFMVVSIGWIVVSCFGSLPYIFTGYLPSFADAFFETVSGFTTTGASVITDVEALPHGLLFWRSLTQWLGGMGIIALFVAIIAGMGARANQIFRVEVPGPDPGKISPRVRTTAQTLWKTYVVISVVLVILLYVLGMNAFDAFCHTFATMATGGFSTKNTSLAFYASPAIQWTITIFMFISGVNFSLHYLFFKNRHPKIYWKDQEFCLYTGVLLLSGIIISLFLDGTWEKNLRDAFLQVVSIGTTTGFVSADYEQWPNIAKSILFALLLFGGCAGSTGGNIKPGRYLIILKRMMIELKKMVHPRAVLSTRCGSKIISDAMIINVLVFFFLWIMLLLVGTFIMSLLGLDLLSGLTACMTCLGNVGPGFNLVGPTCNFGFINDVGKYFLSILMLVGRLEIYPVLVLFIPEYWKE